MDGRRSSQVLQQQDTNYIFIHVHMFYTCEYKSKNVRPKLIQLKLLNALIKEKRAGYYGYRIFPAFASIQTYIFVRFFGARVKEAAYVVETQRL